MSMSKDNCCVSISIDLKKDRIRIHRATLHKLGDPKLIQLFVSPDCNVAIKAVDHIVPEGQEIKVNLEKLPSDGSFEVYSAILIERMRKTKPNLFQNGYAYRLIGKVNREKKVALFPIDSMIRIENE